ncbi:class I SAM-dependent methyltransferase [Synechococcus sp. HK01-R]|uniref:class I SAM-dependent methyltransferase n=1 Tax=Synechococcus sp. HK01-R TaxID=2751171 RepID=UPI00162864E7|nr:class I SAM-dependent methyltransferase [Synechococcus sp. HK01-R]QNG27875.1 class I SAM-dependent methyltransferase [Synechococcus sp. HK01-R]
MTIETSNQAGLHKNRQDQLDKSTLFIDSFLASMSQESDYQYNDCPTCGNKEAKKLFKKNGGEYGYCDFCDHIFLLKSLKPMHLIEFYKNYPTSSLDWHKNESDFYKRIYNSGLDLLCEHQPAGNLLDIGCSSGYFLSIASSRGYNTYGVEPNKLESTHAKDNGVNIIGSTIDEIPESLKFNAITMWDVLEHIDSPSNFIGRLKSILNPGGVVFIQVPTSESLAARIMRDKCNMFDGIEHLTLFSRKSLIRCFSNCGFEHLNAKSVITDSFAINNYLNYEIDPYLPSNPNPHGLEINCIDFNNIENSFLGYKIQACFRVN